MLDNFDPKEKKAIILFVAFLLLAVAYVTTHELPWEKPVPSESELLLDNPSSTPYRGSTDRFY